MEIKEFKKGMVYLVGAGPGDPGLLTIKGQQCLAEAEVVIYDRLSSDTLLGYAPKNAILIDVGKALGQHRYTQTEINQLLINYGLQGKRVVRLKGGDPFLFGRGGEETSALREMGISFEVIPGVTSAIAVPAYAGIPVTQRKVASSVTFITGHEMEGKDESRLNWEAISRASQTLVILMGAANLYEIVAKLISVGMKETTPVALIENGTTSRQRTLLGNLRTIWQTAMEAGFKSPAIIVVGEVVNFAQTLNWFETERPLLGKRIMITRPMQQIFDLTKQITETGGEVLICPTIKFNEEFVTDGKALISALYNKDWLIFTSVNGVNSFFNILEQFHLDARSLHALKIAAIGEATADAIKQKGIIVDFVPRQYTSEDLYQELGPHVIGKKLLLVRVKDAPPELAEGLKAHGAVVKEFPVYEVQTEKGYKTQIKENILMKTVDAITFTSPSTIKGFLENFDADLRLLDGVKMVCIGPVTASYAREQKLQVAGVAENSTNRELVKVLVEVLGKK